MKYSLLFFLVLYLQSVSAQITPQKIDIVRDQWGVAHIYAETDAEVAYGLAWAHAEDDFKTIQSTLIAGKLMAGQQFGKDGAGIDFFTQFIGAPDLVEKEKNELSPEFRALLDGYIQGINAYAEKHHKEVLHRKLFPVIEDDMLTAFVLSLSSMSGVDKIVGDIAANKKFNNPYIGIGSNGIAISKTKTTTGESFLAVNSHQPFEGPASWYEVHMHSEDGLNMLGSLFPASPTIFHGVNENLGWAHTVNHPDKMDVYQLRMHNEKKEHYYFDGEVLALEKRKAKLKVKILGISIPISKTYYNSVYGPVLENKNGFFAVSFSSNKNLKAIQQWYEMTKTKNFEEFQSVISRLELPDFNVVYADRDHHIYYVSNAKLPLRNTNYRWDKVLPGDTSATLWNQYHSYDELPSYLDPASGYLFNMNNTPFNATAYEENLDSLDFPSEMGFSIKDNNRSVRFQSLISKKVKLSYQDFKRIKFDIQYPDQFQFVEDVNIIFSLTPEDYPEIEEYLTILQKWDRKAESESVGAGLMKVLITHAKGKKIDKAKGVEIVKKSQSQLIAEFGTIQVPLSKLQVHKRGETEMPIEGLPDVIAPMYTNKFGDGLKEKTYVGESYILLARFGEGLPKLESIMPYGASSKPESPHYTDQMEMFVNKDLKPMTLDKEEIYKNAAKIYHPQVE
ncbi:penicillin acylase family protein [Marivirga harenae]|uniref:penicillin acylase family protein n=1 Tax=Marivirga harenae TaxID=2010992 RepID=UPI0026DF1170|nr:penicillin acylase family protein [Marivirga harenae]WKV11230.1 penicillin acylase family protein [Marivirga harenae]|tara:strand:+ start:111105 stop:113132 length:2028 start_codon:yes stop_codon:yes gene_type:complete